MKKLILGLLIAVAVALATDGDYYRSKTESSHGVILVTYTTLNKADSLVAVSIPGTMMPYHIVVKDGVVTDNSIVLVPQVKDTTNATEESTNQND